MARFRFGDALSERIHSFGGKARFVGYVLIGFQASFSYFQNSQPHTYRLSSGSFVALLRRSDFVIPQKLPARVLIGPRRAVNCPLFSKFIACRLPFRISWPRICICIISY